MGTAEGHYFSARPQATSRPGRVRLSARGLEVTLATDSGVFSPRRLDPGTEFLLSHAPDPPATGTFLDLGCGYGPIACTLGAVSPGAQVVAVDINERSRQLCDQNAAALGLTNVAVYEPDTAPDGSFDLIWSNPPVRIGKAALHDLLLRWLRRLAPDGTAVLVVGKNLGADSLQRWLAGQGFPTERLASKRGYRLLEVTASPGTG